MIVAGVFFVGFVVILNYLYEIVSDIFMIYVTREKGYESLKQLFSQKEDRTTNIKSKLTTIYGYLTHPPDETRLKILSFILKHEKTLTYYEHIVTKLMKITNINLNDFSIPNLSQTQLLR